jgi:ABC-2 type transport system permease protein
VPRIAAALMYGLVGVAFLWETFGSLLDVPGWLLAVSPFHDIGLVPGEQFEATAAAVMLVLGGVAAALGVRLFERRDLAGT